MSGRCGEGVELTSLRPLIGQGLCLAATEGEPVVRVQRLRISAAGEVRDQLREGVLALADADGVDVLVVVFAWDQGRVVPAEEREDLFAEDGLGSVQHSLCLVGVRRHAGDADKLRAERGEHARQGVRLL